MESLSHASGLAIGLAQDPTLRVGHGRWAYNPGQHLLQVDLSDGAALDPRNRGLIGHEIGHVRISHYQLFRHAGDLPPSIIANLLNAIEDPRVNSWFCHIFPGAAEWMQAVHDADCSTRLPPTKSLFLQFACVASVADAWGWKPAAWPLDARVAAALRETGAARRRYANEELPTSALDRELAREDLLSVIRCEVEPLLACDRQVAPVATRAEALALISAARAHRLFEEAVLPAAARLIARDLSSLGSRTEKDPRFQRAIEAAVSSEGSQLAVLVEQALANEGTAKPGRLELDAYVAFITRRAGLQPGIGLAPMEAEVAAEVSDRSMRRRRRRKAEPQALDAKIDQVLGSQLAPLLNNLRIAFQQRSRWRHLRGFPTGSRLDLRAGMRFSIDRRDHDRLWTRPRLVDSKPEAAVLLLVDLSGSMAGAEIEAAILGTTLLAHVFQRLGPGVRFAVEGFQDQRIPFKGFAQPLTDTVLDSFKEMALEVAGDRPGGHNRPAYNDDGPCLREAAAVLLAQPCRRRLLLVVSDCRPSGCRSDADDLRTAVVEVSRHLHVVGLGLGSGTAHVEEFYPHAVADIPSEDFARAIGSVVVFALRGRKTIIES